MNFKKSYAVLIVMAIFLLISIGSVCASENATTDSDTSLSTADNDVVLSDDGAGALKEDTTEKINTTIDASSDKEKFGYDEEKNITVSVKDNETNPIQNITKDNLTLFEGTKSINFTYNNSKITILDKLSVGNHTLNITYLGNSNYTSSTTSVLLKIFGNYTLITPNSVNSDDGNVIIPVKLFDGVDYLEVTKDNMNLTLIYTDSSGNVTNMTISSFDVNAGNVTFILDQTKFVAASITLNYTDVAESKNIILRLSTTVNANDDKIKITDDKNVTVTVLDGQNNPLDITKADLNVLENGKAVSFDYNNSVIKINSLAIGVHNLTIVYNGNDTYATSNKTIILKVWGNQTINPDKTAKIDGDGNVKIFLNLTDGADPVNVDLNNLTVAIFYTQGNTTLNKTVTCTVAEDNQTIKFNIGDITFDSAYADIKYVAENNLTGKTTLKIDTIINVPDVHTGQGEVINFTVEVISVNGVPISVNESNIKILNADKNVKISVNGSVITISDTFTFGVYNLTIEYRGNDTYAESVKYFTLTIYGINTTTATNINSTKIGKINATVVDGNGTVNITKDDLKLNVTYKNGNDTVVINIVDYSYENGTLSFTLENGNFTSATLNIKYNNTEVNVTLNRIYNAAIQAVTIENEYRNGNFTFRLVDIDDNNATLSGKSITLYTVGNIRAGFSGTTDANGIVSYKTINLYVFDQSSSTLSMKQLEVGSYEVEISSSGDVKSTSLKTNLTIVPANININIAPYNEYYGEDKNIEITVTNAKNGESVSSIILKLDMPQTTGKTYYIQTDADGKGKISAKNLMAGSYSLTVSNNDTKNIVSKSVSTTINVLKIPVKVTATGGTIYYNSGTTSTITVTKDGKPLSGMNLLVKLYTSSTKYKTFLLQTNSKGKVAFMADLNVGSHKMIISSADTRYNFNQVTKTIKVKKAKAKITAKKVTTYYKGGKYFTIKLTNTKTKKGIYNAKMTIKVYVTKTKYYNYKGNTGLNGKLKLLINLKPGTYKVVVAGRDSKNYSAKQVTTKIVVKKAPTKFKVVKKTVKKSSKKPLQIKAINKKTKKVISGIKIKIKVYTGKKVKTYTKKTNSKGIAKLSVKKLKVGKHKIIVSSANKYCVGKNLKTTIKIKK